ncbi:MAG: tRNA pseudouridine synthase B [Candidatus Nomurabacteria bacterium GW2011_GWC2_35_8]|uniref:tRNA pseudouridine(55) synthase n=1 Tax=Candidatus Nomurabacteria bacterium GW2011_GWC2_35_8 TaxID=1618752 RepID=A0A0G0DIA9_9BACT|nr:MAG: tRNA pseudouridine synthase B [Candidatus Nomurabacteria bacterium GW2011_GWC2_35_8]
MNNILKKILLLNKKEGETPLSALESFRKKNKKYKDVKMTYAGRLDPMASGLLLVLSGEETKNKEKYLALDKEYEFEVLFGFATDTYDILGKVLKIEVVRSCLTIKELGKKIKDNLKFFTGKFKQKYPIYSSKTVKGKQLFEYARVGEEVEVPEHEVFVKELKFFKLRKINNKKLLENIEKRIKKIKGKIWHKNLTVKHRVFDTGFYVARFRIKCSSGTYVRSISDGLGQKIGIPALAFSIKRTRIGNLR